MLPVILCAVGLILLVVLLLSFGLMRMASRTSREDEITELHYIKNKTEGESQ